MTVNKGDLTFHQVQCFVRFGWSVHSAGFQAPVLRVHIPVAAGRVIGRNDFDVLNVDVWSA